MSGVALPVASQQPSALFSRAGRAATAIGQDLLWRSPGDRIPTVADYARAQGVGINTVQRALEILAEQAAVQLLPRGRLGTFLVSVDRGQLWRLAMGEGLVGFLPLPYSARYEGLATALRESIEPTGVPFSVAFMSGARRRRDAIRLRNAFAVISLLAAEELEREEGDSAAAEVAVVLPPGSYVSRHGVIKRRDGGTVNRVGIDRDSIDQAMLSRAEFGEAVEYIPTHYLQVVSQVRHGLLDAAVWSLDPVSSDAEIVTEPLRAPEAVEMEQKATRAALIVPSTATPLTQYLKSCLDFEAVLATQQEVASGARLPAY